MSHELSRIVEGFLASNAGGLATARVNKQDGESVFTIGDKGHYMYLVEAGRIEIIYEGQTLEMVEAGGIVGEMALVDDDGRRSADAVARQYSTLIPINQRRFRDLVQRNPDFALAVMTVLTRRLREMNERARAA